VPVIWPISTPEAIFGVASGVDKRLFLNEHRRTKIGSRSQPEKQHQADNRYDSDNANSKVKTICYARAYAEYQAALTISVEATKRSIVHIPGVSTHPFLL
jgi:hypothetical protein